MNILRCNLSRQATRVQARPILACRRSYAAATPQRERVEERPEPPKPIPDSPAFYTTRAVYYDQISSLEKAIGRSETFLRQNHLLPLPDFAKASLPALQSVWKDQQEMAIDFKTKMTTTRYRKVTKLLNQLLDFERIATTGGCPELAEKLRSILEMYESSKKEAYLARGKRKPVVLDKYGRSYTLGKRKTSSARVWMIPVKPPSEVTLSFEQETGLPGAPPVTFPVTTSTILVNNLPLNQFFPLTADRERVTRPLKVAGVLGKYNIFAIVRGGGTTGQSGALAHGISKGIVAHEPDLETMFRRGKEPLT